MTLADQTGLNDLLAGKVSITAPKIASGAANLAPKLTTLIAAMCAGADSIDDIDLLRSGGVKHLFGSVYAPSTVGTLLRERRAVTTTVALIDNKFGPNPPIAG
jgi:hypothetical protein